MPRIQSIARQAIAFCTSLSLVGLPLVSAASDYAYQVPLTGTTEGVAAGQLSFNPAGYDFGTLVLGSASGTSVILRNTGQDAVHLTGFNIPGPYSQANNCPDVLVGGATCSVTVTYNPQAAGSFSGNLEALAQEAGVTASVALHGAAVVPTTTLALSSNTVTFGSADVGTLAGAQSVTITNTGNSPATVSGVGVSSPTGEFNQSNDCGAALAPGAHCTVNLSFVPNAYGARSGNLNMYEAASGSLYSVALGGSGNAAVLVMSPSAVTFAAAVTNYASSTGQVTLSNTGNLVLTGLSLDAGSADYSLTASSCAQSLAAGTSCQATITFAPQAAGVRSGSLLAFSTNGGGGSVSLTGSGIAQAPAVQASLSSLNFGSIPVDGSSTSQQITYTNTGNVPVVLGGVGATAGSLHYGVTSSCGASLAVGASCTASVTFTPLQEGTQAGVVRAAFASGNVDVALSGVGTLGQASLSASGLSFADQQVASSSNVKSITVTNTGNRNLTFTGVSVVNGATSFAQSNNCALVTPAGTCTVNVTFTPSQSGDLTGAIALVHDGVAGTSVIDLTGIGRTQTATLTSPSLTTTAVGANSMASATLTNTGIGDLTVTPPSASSIIGSGYSFVSTTCGASVPVGADCSVTLQFSPTSTATMSGQVSIATGAGTKVSSFTATGVQGAAGLSQANLSFVNQTIGTTGTGQSVTLTNVGTAPLAVSGIGMLSGSSDFNQTNTCGATLSIGSSCTITVAFTPTALGVRNGLVGFATNGSGAISFAVTGTSVATAGTTASFGQSVITVGDTSTFTWSTTNAASASVSCTGLAVGSGSGLTGAISVSVPTAGLGSCTVTATNSLGVQSSSSANITAVAVPVVSSATFSPSAVTEGNSTTFSWTTTSATSASVTCNAPAYGSGTGVNSSISVSTSGSGTGSCVVTATNAAGRQATRSTSLSVSPAYSYGWATDDWSTPSGCGSVTATRSVWCERSDTQSVSDSYCGGGKPSSTSSTTNYDSCSYGFVYGAWSSAVGCGSVTQTRSATCKRNGTTTVDASYCGTPDTSQTATVYNSCSYTVTIDGWSGCSTSCGTGTQSRSVSCTRNDGNGTTVANSYCGSPATSQSCSVSSGCTFTANIGGWGTCSNSCGTGTQSRTVSCTNDTTHATVANSNCGSPATSQSCTGNTGCAAPVSWQVTNVASCATNTASYSSADPSGTCTAGATYRQSVREDCAAPKGYTTVTYTCK